MTSELREKIDKVYQLINHGTDGEKQAAKAALDRIIKKYNISAAELMQQLGPACFTYRTKLDYCLLVILVEYFSPGTELKFIKRSTDAKGNKVKQMLIHLPRLDEITVECAYEYFRRHMAQQFKIVSAAELARCKKNKTKRKRYDQLQQAFFNVYVVKSNLYNPVTEKMERITKPQELKDYALMQKVEGGKYNKQVITNKLLE